MTVTKRVGTISYSCGVEVVLLLDEEPVAWMVLNDEGLGPDMLAGDGLFTGAVTIDPAAPPDEAGVEIFCTCGGECEPCEISGSEPIF